VKDFIIVPSYTSDSIHIPNKTKFPPIKIKTNSTNTNSNTTKHSPNTRGKHIENESVDMGEGAENEVDIDVIENDNHISTTGEINVTLIDARMPINKDEKDMSQRDWDGIGSKPEKITVDMEFMGAKNVKWDREATKKKRDNNQHNYEKIMKSTNTNSNKNDIENEEEEEEIPEVHGMECFRFCVRGLKAACTYKINLLEFVFVDFIIFS